MKIVIAILSPGAMGSAISVRLVEHGARVLTLLEGRSAATVNRARAAGMEDVSPETIATADLILSIVPPSEAVGLAKELMTHLSESRHKPVYIDCNALSPKTKTEIAGTLAEQELGESLPQLLSKFQTGIPDMYPKAYRWVAEMREIAAFLDEDKAAAMMFEGAAQLYDRLATDVVNEGKECGNLNGFFHSR